MGFGTNRVVGKTLNKTSLSSNQIKGMNMLKSICDVKKQPSATTNAVEEKKELDNEKKQERKPSRLKNLMALENEEERRDANKIVEETKQVNKNQIPIELTKQE